MPMKPVAALCVAATLFLSACSISKQDSGTFWSVPEDEGRVVTNSAIYEGIQPVRVGFADFSEKEEYVLYRSPRGQAEMVFIEVRERRIRNYALDFNKLVAKSVPLWRFNSNERVEFEPSMNVKGTFSDFWVRRYTQVSSGRSCIGFVGAWDNNASDPDFRPTKALFGYHCAPSGTALTDEDAKNFVTSLDIRGISIPLRIETAYILDDLKPEPPSRREQVAQLVIAQDGIAGGVSGLPAFPLLIARTFPTGDGCPTINC